MPAAVWSPVRGIATALLTPLRFSAVTGHWRSSLKRAACARDGAPLPWYTYPAIDMLSVRDFSGRRVLEFGGGQSTLWWARRAEHVFTIEEDEAWHDALRARCPPNVTLHHVPADTAGRTIAPVEALLDRTAERFDVIVVDGHLRRELAVLAFDYLAPGGAILLDNAEGYGFQEALQHVDCRRIDFYGFAPGVSMRHCTSLVYRGDCFLLAPQIPIIELEGHH